MEAARTFLHSMKRKLEDWFSRSTPIPADSPVVEGPNSPSSFQSLDLESGPSPSTPPNGPNPIDQENYGHDPNMNIPPNNFDWTVMVVGFCLTSAVEIALQSLQPQITLPLHVHVLSLAMVLSFCSFFISNFISAIHFPRLKDALIQVGKLSVFVAFFLAITVPFPLSFKLLTWFVFVLSLLVMVYAVATNETTIVPSIISSALSS